MSAPRILAHIDRLSAKPSEKCGRFAQASLRAVLYHKGKGAGDRAWACNLCKDRVAAGKDPACVAECPWFARHFGDLDDPKSEAGLLIVKVHGIQKDKSGTNPSIFYLVS
jgi:Fe-S-cluster-containing dehydrogenase component